LIPSGVSILKKPRQAAPREGSQVRGSALAKVQSVVIVAVVAIAAVSVGVYMATWGPSPTPVPSRITTTPVVPTAPTTTPAYPEREWCELGWIDTLAETLATRPFTIRGPQIRVELFNWGLRTPPDASVSATVLTAEGDEQVATGSLQQRGDSLIVEAGAGTYYVRLASTNVTAYGSYHVHVLVPTATAAGACPVGFHTPETNYGLD
jgi:hypothetical protein